MFLVDVYLFGRAKLAELVRGEERGVEMGLGAEIKTLIMKEVEMELPPGVGVGWG